VGELAAPYIPIFIQNYHYKTSSQEVICNEVIKDHDMYHSQAIEHGHKLIKQNKNSVAFSPQANYTD
jgi:hypothetical protein